MIFLDANVLLAYDNEEDVHHARAVWIFQEIERGSFGEPFISDYIFNEVVGVTFRKRGRVRALFIGERLLSSVRIFNIDKAVLAESWKLFSATPLRLNLVDCSSIMVATLTKAECIATFDQEFKKLKNVKIVD